MKDLDLTSPAPRVTSLEEAQTLIDQLWPLVQSQARQLQEQARRISELEDAVGLDSQSSSKPPSSDSAAARANRKRKKGSGRPKGGQPGHKRHERALVSEQEVDEFERHDPPRQCSCGSRIDVDAQPCQRHQIFDLPLVRYHVTEHQVYQGQCPSCGQRYRGEMPDSVPRGQMGPGLISEVVLLNGQYRQSLRQVQHYLQARWQLRFSLGAISQAQRRLPQWLSPIYAQIGEWLRQQPVVHADETTHYHGRSRYWLWTMCTDQVAYYLLHYSRGKAVAQQLLGGFDGVLITDRLSSYGDYPRWRRQVCWAHVIRTLERISRRQGEAGELGTQLVRLAQLAIRVVHHHRRGHLSAERYRRRLIRLRQRMRRLLQYGAKMFIWPRTQGQCRALLADEPMLWTFLRHDRLALTNNSAERALRSYVIWRKTSFFSQALQGLQFRPMILTVVETAKRLDVNAYDLLRQICEAGLQGRRITTRLPLPEPATPCAITA